MYAHALMICQHVTDQQQRSCALRVYKHCMHQFAYSSGMKLYGCKMASAEESREWARTSLEETQLPGKQP